MSSEIARTGSLPTAAPSRGLPDLGRHLEPERLVKACGPAISQSAMAWMNSSFQYAGPGQRERLTQELAECPSATELTGIATALAEALATKPSRKVTQASVAILFDSRARGPQNPEVYLEALVYDLLDEGFPPAVVVAACQKLRREQVFTPEIAEVLAACREKLKAYSAVQKLAERLVEIRAQVEVVLLAIEVETVPAPREVFDPNAVPGDEGR